MVLKMSEYLTRVWEEEKKKTLEFIKELEGE